MVLFRARLTISRRQFVAAASAAAVLPGTAKAGSAVTPKSYLARAGRAVARIYIAPGDADQATAISELNRHLFKMSGAELPVVTIDPANRIDGPGIVLGELANGMGAKQMRPSPSKEGFRIVTRGPLLLIGGDSAAAVQFGVYRLLEELGCEWVMPGEIGEIVPRKPTVPLPLLNIVEAPAFQSRRLWYGGGRKILSRDDQARMDEWLRRQRGGYRQTPATRSQGHHWGTFIRKHRKEFETDPSMYALRPDSKGVLERRGPQIETTHPRVIELMVQDIKAAFAKNGWPLDHSVGFAFGPSDGTGFSVSPESLAAGSGKIDALTGKRDVTDLIVLLGNTIIERLGPEYPNVYLGFYSYAEYSSFPSRYTPHPRIVPIFAPIGYSRFHSLVDETSFGQRHYKSQLDKWGALARRQGNPMLFRGYSWNLADNMLPYSKARIWGEELPYYAAMGVEGLNVEATKAWSINGHSDWIFMKLAWNPHQDWRMLLAQYCRKSFGGGAAPMETYLLRLTERQHDAGQEAGSYHSFPLIYDREFITAAEADLARARSLAAIEDDRTRIGYVALGIQALRLYLDYFDATLRFDFSSALAHYEAMHEHWRKSYALNPDLVGKEAPQHLERFIGPFVRDAAALAGDRSQAILPLPDALPTVLVETGQTLPPFEGRPFLEGQTRSTRTYSSTWSAQYLPPVQSVRYQHKFRLPREWGNTGVGLFLGGFDDEARVWLNGAMIGSSGTTFSRPAQFYLSSAIDPEGENLLSIEVVRNSPLNELGVGGLFRPSFLFAAPTKREGRTDPHPAAQSPA